MHKLRAHPAYLPEFSRVAVAEGHVVGTIMYFLSKVWVGDREIPVPSFGPLCADHRYKNHGIGAKLLEGTLPLVKAAGYRAVDVKQLTATVVCTAVAALVSYPVI